MTAKNTPAMPRFQNLRARRHKARHWIAAGCASETTFARSGKHMATVDFPTFYRSSARLPMACRRKSPHTPHSSRRCEGQASCLSRRSPVAQAFQPAVPQVSRPAWRSEPPPPRNLFRACPAWRFERCTITDSNKQDSRQLGVHPFTQWCVQMISTPNYRLDSLYRYSL